MKRYFVRKSYRVDPDKLTKAKKVLGAASEAEAVRMAIEMVIDHEETMALARKIMKEQSEALRELAICDREIKPDKDQESQKSVVAPKQSKRATGKVSSVAGLISQERSDREEALLGAFRGGKEKHAGKRNNQ